MKALRAGLIVLAAAVILGGIAACKRFIKTHRGSEETSTSASDVTGTGGSLTDTSVDAAALASILASNVSDTVTNTSDSTAPTTTAASDSTAATTSTETTATTRPHVSINANDFPAAISSDFKYSIENGLATIDSYLGSGGTVSIPSSIGGVPVYAIGACAFSGTGGTSNQKITAVIIPSGVAKIGNMAFSSCVSLKSVTIPKSVTEIGDFAFENCPNVVIKCAAKSFACSYAIENNISYIN